MARNGAGTYSLPSGNPVVTNTTISSTTHNNTNNDIATALTQSLAYDGQTVPVANLPMGTYRHTGVGSAVATTDYARYDQVQNGAPTYLSSVTGTNTITATAAPTPAAYAAGQTFRFVSANANTGAVTLNVSSLGAKAITKGGSIPLFAGDVPSGAVCEVIYDGTQFQLVNVRFFPNGMLSGCTLSTAGSSATMSIAAGTMADSTNIYLMKLSAIAKTTSAWAVGTGNGGLDTGAIANNTWYHFYGIERVDTGVTDAIFSTNATTPTLPANYPIYRYIGSGLTNGSAQWTAFTQLEDEFLWLSPPVDINVSNLGTSQTSYVVSTPVGIQTTWMATGYVTSASANIAVYISSLDVTDVAASTAGATTAIVPGAGLTGTVYARARTSVTSSIRARASAASTTLQLSTIGYINTRGRAA